MKHLIDSIPGLAFIIAFFASDKNFLFATYVLVAFSALQLLLSWLIWKKVDKMHWVVFLILLPMAGLTILFNDANYLKWKPTIVCWIFSALLYGSQLIGNKNISQRIIEGLTNQIQGINLSIPNNQWLPINIYITLFFVFSGAINLFIAFNFSTETWVTFKVFGLLGLNVIGMLLLLIYLSRFMKTES